MKKLLIIPILLLAISCKKISSNKDNSAIVGKWYLKKSYTTVYINGTLTSSDTTSTYNANNFEQFNADNSCTISLDSKVQNKTYVINGNSLTINFDEPATYTLSQMTSTSFVQHSEFETGTSKTIYDGFYSK